jgi:glycosyltransferase involved in cell wall biosynthesis
MTTGEPIATVTLARAHATGLEPRPEAGQKRPGARAQVTVVIPAYNEERGVAEVVRHVGEVLAGAGIEYEILVVDDGSQDGTVAAARTTTAHVIQHGANRGYGAALKTGIRAARYPMICITDADSTYPAEQLPRLIAEAEEADMVVGARTSGAVQIPMARRPAKWFLNALANYLTDTRIPDLNSGLRVMRRALPLEYFDILPDRFSFTTTITLAGLCDGYTIKFIPVEYRRRVGKSKIKPIEALNFLTLILRTMTYFRPLRILLPVAFVLFLIGATKFVIDWFYSRLSGTSVLFLLAALNTVFFGVLADMLCFVRRHRAAPQQ